ncbi:MAG: hypothetical protein ACPG4N_05925 [Gammaproteobacteria bacterium]
MERRFTKNELRQLRELAALAHERALEDALEPLYEDFLKWADDGHSAFDLNDLIHQFHNGISRELYKLYVLDPPHLAVIAGLECKALSKLDFDSELYGKVAPLLDVFDE